MCVCVCYVARRRLDGVAVRGSHRSRVVAERALPRRRAPAVRAAVRCADASTYYLSDSAPARVLGPDAAAHVKILISHDASEAGRWRVAARRRCASVSNSKFMAARVGWRSLASLSRLVRAQYSLSRQANLAYGETLAPKNAAIQMTPCIWCPRGRHPSKARDDRSSTGPPGSSQSGLSIALFTRCPARRRLGV